MERDLRDTPSYQEVKAYFEAIYQPGANFVSDGGEVTLSPRWPLGGLYRYYVQRPAVGADH